MPLKYNVARSVMLLWVACETFNDANTNEVKDRRLRQVVCKLQSIGLTLVASTALFLLKQAKFESHALADAIDIPASTSTFVDSWTVTIGEASQTLTVKGSFPSQLLDDGCTTSHVRGRLAPRFRVLTYQAQCCLLRVERERTAKRVAVRKVSYKEKNNKKTSLNPVTHAEIQPRTDKETRA